MLDHEGKEVPGNRGYKYFGAARDLPGVKELFMRKRKDASVPIITCYWLIFSAPKASRKTRGELAKNVDADYYGYRDEDDGVIRGSFQD